MVLFPDKVPPNIVGFIYQNHMSRENIYLMSNKSGLTYVTGGIEGVNSSSEVIRYSRLQGTRKTMPSLLESLHAHALAANEHRIFVLGGRQHYDGNIFYLSTCEYLSPVGVRYF